MKVVEYGDVKPRVCCCKGCNVQLEYTPYDVKKHINKFHEYYYVICPVCGKWIFINV